MNITFTQQEEDFRQELRDFLERELPDGWDPLGQPGETPEERYGAAASR